MSYVACVTSQYAYSGVWVCTVYSMGIVISTYRTDRGKHCCHYHRRAADVQADWVDDWPLSLSNKTETSYTYVVIVVLLFIGDIAGLWGIKGASPKAISVWDQERCYLFPNNDTANSFSDKVCCCVQCFRQIVLLFISLNLSHKIVFWLVLGETLLVFIQVFLNSCYSYMFSVFKYWVF